MQRTFKYRVKSTSTVLPSEQGSRTKVRLSPGLTAEGSQPEAAVTAGLARTLPPPPHGHISPAPEVGRRRGRGKRRTSSTRSLRREDTAREGEAPGAARQRAARRGEPCPASGRRQRDGIAGGGDRAASRFPPAGASCPGRPPPRGTATPRRAALPSGSRKQEAGSKKQEAGSRKEEGGRRPAPRCGCPQRRCRRPRPAPRVPAPPRRRRQ